MKKITTLGLVMLFSLFSFFVNAQINFDLTSVDGSITMGYDAVSAEIAKDQSVRWINATSFPGANTSGKCSSVSSTFKMVSGNSIEFWLDKCDEMVISANMAVGRNLSVSINGGAASTVLGTNSCAIFNVPINSEVPCKILVKGTESKGAYVSLFTFNYTAKTPTISDFKINGTSAVIDQTAKTITLQMPFGTDITNVIPEVILGGSAVGNGFTPAGAQDFSTGPITYTVTDNTTPVNYTVNISVKATPDTDKAITSMTINAKAATINEEAGTISCDFPSFTGAVGNWPVSFVLSGGTAIANFTSGSNYDFVANGSLVITVTAQDLSTKAYTVTPTISTKKNIGMLTANGKAEAYDDLLLSAFSDYYVSILKAGAAPADINDFYANYDLLVLHANVGGTDATGVASKAMVGVKPVLNLKVFFYNSGRWGWSTVAPANAAAGSASAEVEARLQNHPVFANVNFTGTTLNYYDNLPVTNTNAIQYASDLGTLSSEMTSHTIATSGTGIQMHEIQDVAAAKYLMIGLSMEGAPSNFTYFNSNTINILKNSAAYLLSPTSYPYISTGLKDNPKGNLVYFSDNTIFNPEQYSIEVYNSAGMKVISSNEKSISTQSISNGIYILRTTELKPIKFVK